MIAGLKPYPAYKDSGVEWLGDVPKHWDVLPNRAIFNEVKDRDYPDEPMLSVTIKRGIIRQVDLLEDSSKKDGSNLDRSHYKLVQPGDIAYNKMRAWQGAIGVSDYRGIVSPAYVIQRPRDTRSSRYFHHLFRIPGFAKEAERWSYGITSDMWSLRPEHFKLIYSSVPPIPEQTAIVHFLDYVNRRIKRYIAAKQRLIKLLEGYKHSLINQAVTGLIDVRTGKPYPAYKDSGVEYVGEVPEHWEVRKLRPILKRSTERNRPDLPLLSVVREKGVILRDIASKEENHNFIPDDLTNYKVVKKGQFAMNKMKAWQGSYGVSQYTGIVSPAYFIFNIDGVSGNFFHVAIRSKAYVPMFTQASDGVRIGQWDLSEARMREIKFSIPSIPEQIAIVRFLDQKCESIDKQISQTRRAVELIREYRTRLIAGVVTGKIDVRGTASRLPIKENTVEKTEASVDGEELNG